MVNENRTLAVSVELEVPFCDTDALGIVWHGNYYRYFALAKSALNKAIRYDYEDQQRGEFSWFVTETRCRHVAPLRYGSRIRVTARLAEMSMRLKTNYLIEDISSAKAIARGYTTHAAVNKVTGELAKNCPPELEEAVRIWLASKSA